MPKKISTDEFIYPTLNQPQPDSLEMATKEPQNDLITLVTMRMPYGKYKGWILADVPERYLVWYHAKGFPDGKLGQMLGLLYEIKLNGLEYLLKPLREQYSPGR